MLVNIASGDDELVPYCFSRVHRAGWMRELSVGK
jgi:hypothetical protein